jgi:hypothetical protein
MAISVGDALLKVGVDTKEATSKLEDFGNKIKATGQSISRASTPFLVAGGAIVGALTGIVMKAATVGEQMDKMSLRTGISVENLSRLRYAADLSGVGIEGVETSLKFLTKGMNDASNGTGTAMKAFEELGIKVVDANNNLRPTIDVMKEAATKIAAIENPAKQAALAMEMFGARSGTDLLPLLKEGGKGIDELMKKADDLGITMSTKSATAAAEFNDSLDTLKASLGGVGVTIGTTLMPIVMDFVNNSILPLIKKFQEIPIETLMRDIKILAGVGGIGLLIGTVGKLIGAITSIGPAVSILFSFPTGLIIAGIALAVLGIIELVKHWDAIKTAMTGFYEKWIKPWLDPFIKGLEWIVNLVEKIVNWFKKGMGNMTVNVTGAGEALGGRLQTGGIVTRPTIAMIGEGGPEAVIPLSKLGDNESKRLLNEVLRELRKLNEIVAPQLGRQISLSISGMGSKV